MRERRGAWKWDVENAVIQICGLEKHWRIEGEVGGRVGCCFGVIGSGGGVACVLYSAELRFLVFFAFLGCGWCEWAFGGREFVGWDVGMRKGRLCGSSGIGGLVGSGRKGGKGEVGKGRAGE